MGNEIQITREDIDSAYAKAVVAVGELDEGLRPLNKSLLRKTARAIKKEGRYNQHSFAKPSSSSPCGTTCCIAGEFLLQSGFTPQELLVLAGKHPIEFRKYRFDKEDEFCEEYQAESAIQLVASRLAGLTEDEAERLFAGTPEDNWHQEYADAFEEDPEAAAASYLRAIASGKVELS